jgi:peptide/nickel transport system substrate-binding protein
MIVNRVLTYLATAAVLALVGAAQLAASPAAEPAAEAPEPQVFDPQSGATDRNTYFTVSQYEELTDNRLERFNEAPMLAAMVRAGSLPPVEQRLPEEPLVLRPLSQDKSIGSYGGVLRISRPGADYMGPASAEKQHFLSAEFDYSANIFPNLAESVEAVAEGREWIFHMRRGLRWSDGTPWSTADIMFWYEDIAGNEEFTPNTNYVLLQDTPEPIRIEAVDDITWKIVASRPYHLEENIEDLMTLPPLWPKHYLDRFHPKYQDAQKLANMVKEAGFSSWVELMETNSGIWGQERDPDKPVMTPWMVTQPPPAKTHIYQRNPYFHAVDIAGNQLPYIDYVHVEQVADVETAKLRIIAGDDDFFSMRQLDFFPLVKQEERRGRIRVTRWKHSTTAVNDLEFNLTIADPVLRSIFRDKDFRFGVSHAINREAINELIFNGMLQPQQPGWSKNVPYYNERLNTTAIEFDPQKAGELLDAAGLDKRTSDGWRLRPDGKRFELNIVGMLPWGTTRVAEILVDQLRDAGIFANYRDLDWGIGNEMIEANQIESFLMSGTWWTEEGAYLGMNAVGVPVGVSPWAPLWNDWFHSQGARGEEPIPEVKQSIDAYWAFRQEMDPEQRKQHMQIITDNAADNLWVVGILSPGGFVVAYNAKLMNVPTDFRAHNRGDNGRPATWFFGE